MTILFLAKRNSITVHWSKFVIVLWKNSYVFYLQYDIFFGDLGVKILISFALHLYIYYKICFYDEPFIKGLDTTYFILLLSLDS